MCVSGHMHAILMTALVIRYQSTHNNGYHGLGTLKATYVPVLGSDDTYVR